MGINLVIVESPTKAKTIAKFLDSDYIVESSIGHIRDLPDSAKEIPAEHKKKPWARLGIDVENNFKPLYLIPEAKKAHVTKLKGLLKKADRLFLATDEDREGESISWHLLEVLQPKVPTERLVFHEITKTAIKNALQATRAIDTRLVTAQETRRVLDRLYGYEISPVLWRKIAPALSAGRVQSVAIRVIVQRERERMAFKSARYWDLEGIFQGSKGGEFGAVLLSLDGKRLATGKDFEDTTGQLYPDKAGLVVLDEQEAHNTVEQLATAEWKVVKVEQKPFTTKPPPPFITSTLQQEANRKLRLSSQDTMRAAQGLYEQGHITYMRTDSTTLSSQAVTAARNGIADRYGKEFLPDQPPVYLSKVKNAQEAHEAIRPAGESFALPESLRTQLSDVEYRVYDMVWKRTMASQMLPARAQRMVLQVAGGGAVFQTTGRRIEFPGFLRAYVEGSDDPEADLGDQEKILPPLAEGEKVENRGMEPREHVTLPPARFSEAALIKELEKEGIGRPSTYASIISTIVRRQYVNKRGSALVPSFTAFAVVQLLEEHFSHLVDLQFTARMEDALDAISRGEQESLPYLKGFYYGQPGLTGLQELLKAEIDPRQACTIPFGADSNDRAVSIRVGKFGPYLERGEERASLPDAMAPDELTMEQAERLLEKGNNPDVLGVDPGTGMNVYLKAGRYGPYVQLGEQGETPKMKSLLPGQKEEDVTLEDALRLLSLPRNLGNDPETGEEITVDLGRYGPYTRRGKDSRTLPGVDALFSFTLENAVELYKQEKAARRFGAKILREIGQQGESGPTINLMSGRFGPYVSDGETNAAVPRAHNPETLTLEQALELIRARAARGPVIKKTAKAKSTEAKKGATKTAAAKKGATKTAATKKGATKATGKKRSTAAKAKAAPRKTGAREAKARVG